MIQLSYPKFWNKIGYIAILLSPFTLLYMILGYLRSKLARPVRFPGFAICVGNITAGGNGKTQIVAMIAKHLSAKQKKFVIITKGYGSRIQSARIVTDNCKAPDVGDESIMLTSYGKVIAAENLKDASILCREIQPEVVIFDDGMQNPKFVKDCTIAVFDAGRGLGNGMYLPSGPVRFPSNIKVDASIIIGKDAARIPKKYKDDVFLAKIVPEKGLEIEKKKTKYFAFCAIGNPERFLKMLGDEGVILAGSEVFPDHHFYTEENAASLEKKAQSAGAKLITTAKDYVKIKDHLPDTIVFDVDIEMDNANRFWDVISARFGKAF